MAYFPFIKYNGHFIKVKLFNRLTEKYLSLSDKSYISTLDNANETKADFYMYFFETNDVDIWETQVVLLVNSNRSCLAMTDDKKLDKEGKVGSKLTALKKADRRFFYYKNPRGLESTIALEGMNGKDKNYYLAVDDNESKLILKQKKGDITDNMLFQLIPA